MELQLELRDGSRLGLDTCARYIDEFWIHVLSDVAIGNRSINQWINQWSECLINVVSWVLVTVGPAWAEGGRRRTSGKGWGILWVGGCVECRIQTETKVESQGRNVMATAYTHASSSENNTV